MKQSEKPEVTRKILEELGELSSELRLKNLRIGTLTRQLSKTTKPVSTRVGDPPKPIRIVETHYGVERKRTPESEFTFFTGPISKTEANELVDFINEKSPGQARVVTRGLTEWSSGS